MSATPLPRLRSPSESSKYEPLLSTLSLRKQSIKRLELPLNKFVKTSVPLHLEILRNHRNNIEKFYKIEAWDRIHKEQINAQRTVQQLKSCIQEIDIVRSQVQDEDLPQFDKLVKPVKNEALQVIQVFLSEWEESGFSSDSPLPLPVIPKKIKRPVDPFNDNNTCENDEQPIDIEHHSDDSLIPGVAPLQVQMTQNVQEAPFEVDASWGKLKEDLVELNELIHGFSGLVTDQQQNVDRVEENIESSRTNVLDGVKNIAKGVKLKAILLPVVGAIVGTAALGPVGFLAGLKIGSIAAAVGVGVGGVGGGFAGFMGGSWIKKRVQNNVDMDLEDLKKLEKTDNTAVFHSMPDLRTENTL